MTIGTNLGNFAAAICALENLSDVEITPTFIQSKCRDIVRRTGLGSVQDTGSEIDDERFGTSFFANNNWYSIVHNKIENYYTIYCRKPNELAPQLLASYVSLKKMLETFEWSLSEKRRSILDLKGK